MSGNFVPRRALGASLGTVAKPWSEAHCGTIWANALHADNLTLPGNVFALSADWTNGVFVRLRDAVGLEPTDFGSYGPWARRRCNLADDGSVTAYYGDSDYAEDGSHGMVMVEQPAFWYRVSAVKVASGHLEQGIYLVSTCARAGFQLHPAFVIDGRAVDRIYLGAYEGSLLAGQLGSVAGQAVATNETRAYLRSAASARGSGWQLKTYAMYCADFLLMITEYGCLNVQEQISPGYFSADVAATGATASLGSETGDVRDSAGTVLGMSWRGEENIYGNVGEMPDGINVNSRANDDLIYVADHGFADGTGAAPYVDSGLVPVPLRTTQGYTSGWTKYVAYSPTCDWAFLPNELGGNSVLPVGDFVWRSSAWPQANDDWGWLVLGNGHSDASAAGPLAMGAMNAATVNSTARLAFVPKGD